MKGYSDMILKNIFEKTEGFEKAKTLELFPNTQYYVCVQIEDHWSVQDANSGENVCKRRGILSSTLGAATNNGLIFLKFGGMVDLLSAHLLVQRSSKTDDYWPRTDLTKLKSSDQNAKINMVQIRKNLQ